MQRKILSAMLFVFSLFLLTACQPAAPAPLQTSEVLETSEVLLTEMPATEAPIVAPATETSTAIPTPDKVVVTLGSEWANMGVPVVDKNGTPLNIEVVKIENEYFALRFGQQIRVGTQNPDGTIAPESFLKYDLASEPEDASNHPWPLELIKVGAPGIKALLGAPENPGTINGEIQKDTYASKTGSVDFLKFSRDSTIKNNTGIAGYFIVEENKVDGGMITFWQNTNLDGKNGEIAPLTYFNGNFALFNYSIKNPWNEVVTALPVFNSKACTNASTYCLILNDKKTISLIERWVSNPNHNVPQELIYRAMTNPDYDLNSE